jgi:hypothetical protein
VLVTTAPVERVVVRLIVFGHRTKVCFMGDCRGASDQILEQNTAVLLQSGSEPLGRSNGPTEHAAPRHGVDAGCLRGISISPLPQ